MPKSTKPKTKTVRVEVKNQAQAVVLNRALAMVHDSMSQAFGYVPKSQLQDYTQAVEWVLEKQDSIDAQFDTYAFEQRLNDLFDKAEQENS